MLHPSLPLLQTLIGAAVSASVQDVSGGVKIFCSEEEIIATLLSSKDIKLFLDQHDPQRRHWDQFWA